MPRCCEIIILLPAIFSQALDGNDATSTEELINIIIKSPGETQAITLSIYTLSSKCANI